MSARLTPHPLLERRRIVVLGYLVRGPLGGMAWHHLQYVLGLRQLGHEVSFLEDSDDYPSCYDPQRDLVDTDPTYGLGFAETTFRRIGFHDDWGYYDAHTDRWLGPLGKRAIARLRSADVLLNVSGVNPLRTWSEEIPIRILIDTDPVFTQVRHLTDPAAHAVARRHTAFFTFAENIGRAECTVPRDGLNWLPTRQPVVPEAWPVLPGSPDGRWTTVMQWESYAEREYAGQRYGLKSASFRDFFELPRRAAAQFELALGGRSAPREALAAHGWQLVDSRAPTVDPWRYQAYIQGSLGEFSVAKQGYVITRSGWFSERSAAYLASGRPVVVQDTGFTSWLPTGAGLFAFSNSDEALFAIEEVARGYAENCRAARDLAVNHFRATDVLRALLERAGA